MDPNDPALSHHNVAVVEVDLPVDDDGLRFQDTPMSKSAKTKDKTTNKDSIESLNGPSLEEINRPLRLASVRINGADRTHSAFLRRICERHLKKSSSDNLLSVMETTRRINAELEAHDLYRSDFTRSSLVRSTCVNAASNDVDLVLDVVEKGRLWLKTSTDVGSSEGTATVSGRLRNVFGGAESAELNYSYGTATKVAYNAVLSTPLLSLPTTTLSLTATRSNKFLPQASVDANVDAAILTLFHSALGAFKAGAHRLAFSAESRSLVPRATASANIRDEVGIVGKKLSLAYSYDLDSRDDNLIPTRGQNWRSFLEGASYERNGYSLKALLAGTFSRPLMDYCNLSWHSGLTFGMLLQSQGCPTTILDRLVGGGSTNVRMFKANSLGPRKGADWMGGNFSWAVGLGLIGTLPNWKPSSGLFWHMFMNVGQVQNRVPYRFTDFQAPSSSIGLGLIYRMNPVRLELNIGLPISASPTDGIKRGFQLGLGSEFL